MIEQVAWRDAHFWRDVPDVEHEDYIVTSVGWVTEGPKFLRIAAERLPHDDGDRAVTYVPNESVVERVNLILARVEPETIYHVESERI